MDIYANDAKLTSFDTYVDLADANYYYLVPDFSKAFLKVSTKDLYGNDTASSKLQNQMLDYFSHPVDADILSKALKKYLPMVTGKVTNVNMKENESVTIDNIDGKYTRLTVRLNERTIYQMET